ncbi:MAG: MerR family transcriptional regulator [Oscillospiraceae bacterium]
MGYTIKQVSQLTGLSISTLRYYDREGLLPELRRRESGYREFGESDLYALELIECCKQAGLRIKEMRGFMSLLRQGDSSLCSRRDFCREHVRRLEARLAAVQAALEHSREILEFHEIAAETGSEAEAAALYAGRRENK